MTHRRTLIPRAKTPSGTNPEVGAETGRATHRRTLIARTTTAPATDTDDHGTPTNVAAPMPTAGERMAAYGASLVSAVNAHNAALDAATTAYSEAKDAARDALAAAFAVNFAEFDEAERADERMALAAARILSS